MTSSFVALLLLYLAIVTTSLLLRDNKTYIWGPALIGVFLLFLDLPDIAEYKYHYQLAGKIGYENILPLYNFERGYVALVAISSQLIPFEAFYVIVVTLAIDSYLRFYCKNTGNQCYIYCVLFLSICLYFIAFTIRTTIASMFLAYALLCLQQKKNGIAAVLIVAGAAFHVVILPILVLPVINHFSSFITKRYFFIYATTICTAFIAAKLFSMDSILGLGEFAELKVLAYKHANTLSNSTYFGLWIVAALGSLISPQRFNDFDRVLVITLLAIILFLYPYEFFQGRFMWLTSFIFIYILAKGTIFRFHFGKTGRLLLVMILPLITFLRF